MTPAALDLLDLDSQLTEEERATSRAAAAYARDFLAPRVVEAARRETCERAVFAEMGARGFLGCGLPPPYGAGMGAVGRGLLAREFERVDSAYRSMWSVQEALAMGAIWRFGSDEQKNAQLPTMARGEAVGCFALTEPGHGSDIAAMQSRAEKTRAGFVLRGEKTWISNAPIADLFVVWARCEDSVRGFLLERDAPGLSVVKIENKLSLRAAATGRVVLDDVKIPLEAALPGAIGLKAAMQCLASARYGIAWGALGAAEFCWHAALEYAQNRRVFGAPLAAKQIPQKTLADMQTEILLGLQGCLRVGRLLEQNRADPAAVSMLKRNSCRKALAVARAARDLHGANGIADEFHIMRHLCNLETVNTYEGAEDIHALILGRAQTGLSAF